MYRLKTYSYNSFISDKLRELFQGMGHFAQTWAVLQAVYGTMASKLNTSKDTGFMVFGHKATQ